MFCFSTDAQSPGTPELAFADGYPVVSGDVILNEYITIECEAHNNTADLLVTDYEWNVTAEDGGSPWTCYETSFSAIVCTVDNDCTMNVTCTPYSYFIAGNPGSINVTVEGDKICTHFVKRNLILCSVYQCLCAHHPKLRKGWKTGSLVEVHLFHTLTKGNSVFMAKRKRI